MTIKAEAKVDGWCFDCDERVRWYLTERGVRAGGQCSCVDEFLGLRYVAYGESRIQFLDRTGLVEEAHDMVGRAARSLNDAARYLADLTGSPVEIRGTRIEPDDE